ncbi:MAG: acetaldehyde dehydrogenase (acetylating) [Patescibacteria group bacterium]|jgi:acetaldehyde dehydrogenase
MKKKANFKKIKVGIIGTGNIGSDLLTKILRSPILECGIFTGHNPDSEGIKRAKKLGIRTSFESIKAIEKNPQLCDIVFDATSAEAHIYNAPILKRLKKFVIDMTPSRIGKMCVPSLNLESSLKQQNINMVSCGGQATTPLAKAIMKINPDTEYIEIVSSISSKSAGIGTRNNIDEYTQTTSEALMYFSGVKKAKAIVNLNPADPPILMHNTIYAQIKDPKIELITEEIKKVVKKIQKYVPGYKLVLEPVYDNGRLTLMVEVTGRGDFLPIYAGNLDIINCAAVAVAEEYAKRKLKRNKYEYK